jgi:hypothetical protein
MGTDRKERRREIERMEKGLWEEGRREAAPTPGDGFEARVMRRIRDEREARACRSLTEQLGAQAWRLAPAVAALLVLVAAAALFWPQREEQEWTVVLTGNDVLVELILDEGEEA